MHDTALLDEEDVLAVVGLVEDVAGHDQRRAFIHQRPEHIPQLAAQQRIEADSRLVENHELGVREESHRQTDAASLAAAELSADAIRVIAQLQLFDDLVAPRLRQSVNAADIVEVFLDGEILEHARRLRRVGHPRPQIGVTRRPPQYLHPAADIGLSADNRVSTVLLGTLVSRYLFRIDPHAAMSPQAFGTVLERLLKGALS